MSKHTPGPWKYSGEIKPCGHGVKHQLYCGEVRADESDRYLGPVCDIQSAAHVDGIGNEEAESNARLIAAAPDLLEALQNMMGAFDNAIRRMKMPSEFCDEAIESARAAIAKAKGEA